MHHSDTQTKNCGFRVQRKKELVSTQEHFSTLFHQSEKTLPLKDYIGDVACLSTFTTTSLVSIITNHVASHAAEKFKYFLRQPLAFIHFHMISIYRLLKLAVKVTFSLKRLCRHHQLYTFINPTQKHSHTLHGTS